MKTVETTKDYLRQQYKLAFSDWQLAGTDQERQQALDSMAKIYNLACQLHGFDFADELQAATKA